MIVTQTPLRVSFLGGGSDYPEFFNRVPGYVLGTAINKYVYVFSHPLPNFAPEKYRFTYRITESVLEHESFKHPVMRATLSYLKWDRPTNFATMSDLPGSSGLGGSSSFTVGLLNVIAAESGSSITANELAELAIEIERRIIGEPGGFQDQYHASIGGFRIYRFHNNSVDSRETISNPDTLNFISDSMALIPLINERDSAEFASETIKHISENSGFQTVSKMASLAQHVGRSLMNESDPNKAFEILVDGVEEGWELKSSISRSSEFFTNQINELRKIGARTGKLCGAGGSGFILVLVHPNDMSKFLKKAQFLKPVKIGIDCKGTRTLLAN